LLTDLQRNVVVHKTNITMKGFIEESGKKTINKDCDLPAPSI